MEKEETGAFVKLWSKSKFGMACMQRASAGGEATMLWQPRSTACRSAPLRQRGVVFFMHGQQYSIAPATTTTSGAHYCSTAAHERLTDGHRGLHVPRASGMQFWFSIFLHFTVF